MRRPLLLDLYCCEGGAGMGFHQAGFDVFGVDLHPQRRYPFPFHQGSALEVMTRLLSGKRIAFTARDGTVIKLGLADFDAIHASPPCQFGTAMNNDKSKHLNLIPQTRAMLRASGKPFVIENVMKVARAGHLKDWISLNGYMFANHMWTSKGRLYVLERERAFETNWHLPRPNDPGAQGHAIANIIGGHLRCRDAEHRTGKGTGKTVDFPGEDRPTLTKHLMGMDWATMSGMSEAVPPSFTKWIGTHLLEHIQGDRP